MTRRRAVARVAAILTIALLVALSAQGLLNAARNLASMATGWQWAMTAAQLVYAALGLAAAWALWRRPAAAPRLALAWGAALVAAPAAIPPAWVPDETAHWWRYAGAGAMIAALGVSGAVVGARR
jgi:hypothetical protein